MSQGRYLENATDFTDIPERGMPPEGMDCSLQCPVCKGHGGWNLILNAYGKGKHFQASCFQCNGWGWVRTKDAECVHEFIELDAEGCRKNGLSERPGNCYHIYFCKKPGCRRMKGVDTSD